MSVCTEELRLIKHPQLWRCEEEERGAEAASVALDLRSCPRDVLLLVCHLLDEARDVLRFGAVSRLTRPIAAEQAVWRRLSLKAFPAPRGLGDEPPGGWLELYK
jgi:hypothetical protein